MPSHAIAILETAEGTIPALKTQTGFWRLDALDAGFEITRPWASQKASIERAAERVLEGRAPEAARVRERDMSLVSPLTGSRAIYAIGANYADHVRDGFAAMQRMGMVVPQRPAPRPLYFSMPPGPCLAASGSVVPMPVNCTSLDAEVELCAVIGDGGRNIAVADALAHVMGYTIALDMSARDFQFAPGALCPVDLFSGKVFDRSCPAGPYLVPADQVGDPQNLKLGLSVNGTTWQDSCTSAMTLDVATTVSVLSSLVTLYPGDVVLTGTPAGTGFERGRSLAPGDRLTGWVAGIGELAVSIGASR